MYEVVTTFPDTSKTTSDASRAIPGCLASAGSTAFGSVSNSATHRPCNRASIPALESTGGVRRSSQIAAFSPEAKTSGRIDFEPGDRSKQSRITSSEYSAIPRARNRLTSSLFGPNKRSIGCGVPVSFTLSLTVCIRNGSGVPSPRFAPSASV